MKKKRKTRLTAEDWERFRANDRELKERIAILDKKIAERKAQRGEA